MINLCWYVGAVWNDKDMTDKFVSKGYWENGWDDKFSDIVNQIKIGDKIAIKSSYTQKNNLPFDIKGETASVMAIKYVGTVTKNYNNGKRVDVDWDKNYEQKTWFFFTWRATIWKVVRKDDDWMYGALLDFTFNDTEQDYNAFLAHPYWANKYSTADQKYGENEMTNDTVKQYADLLKSTHNLILHGAPGTGKTHLAHDIAAEMQAEVDFVQFHPSYDYTDFVEGLRPVNDGNGQIGFERKDGVFKKFCKSAVKNLEDSYKSLNEVQQENSFNDTFLDLLDKIRNDELKELHQKTKVPLEIVEATNNDNIIVRTKGSDTERTYTVSYERLEKLSKVFRNKRDLENIKNIDREIRAVIGGCHSSSYWATLNWIYSNQDSLKGNEVIKSIERKNFVFIIDEINRGELSKIFGELFFSIDPGYRGKDGLIKTQYQNLVNESNVFYDGFYVPENVYIIGTMNDIDRNVESMDFAFRRRFAFKEITAKNTQNQILSVLDDSIREEAIQRMDSLNEAISKIEGLSSSYHIGGAYFLKLKDLDNDFGKLWEYHLAGLLREYLRGMENAKDELDKLRMAYDLENSASQQG